MSQDKEFRTTDTAIASALMTAGYKDFQIKKVAQDPTLVAIPHKAEFVFNGKGIPTLLRKFNNDVLELPAKKLIENYKSLINTAKQLVRN